MSEIENVFLPTIRHDAEVTQENVSQILECRDKFDEMCEQIDNLESLVERIKIDLNKIQKQVEIADEELDIPEKKLDIILKSINFFAKTRDPQETNWNEEGFYQPPEIFKTKDYFNRTQDVDNNKNSPGTSGNKCE